MAVSSKMGFGKNMLELVSEEASALEKAGYDAHKIGAILAEKYEEAARTNARQEDLKRLLASAIKEAEFGLVRTVRRCESGGEFRLPCLRPTIWARAASAAAVNGGSSGERASCATGIKSGHDSPSWTMK